MTAVVGKSLDSGDVRLVAYYGKGPNDITERWRFQAVMERPGQRTYYGDGASFIEALMDLERELQR